MNESCRNNNHDRDEETEKREVGEDNETALDRIF